MKPLDIDGVQISPHDVSNKDMLMSAFLIVLCADEDGCDGSVRWDETVLAWTGFPLQRYQNQHGTVFQKSCSCLLMIRSAVVFCTDMCVCVCVCVCVLPSGRVWCRLDWCIRYSSVLDALNCFIYFQNCKLMLKIRSGSALQVQNTTCCSCQLWYAVHKVFKTLFCGLRHNDVTDSREHSQ